MFEHPGFSVGGMSEDELMRKQDELSRKLGWARAFGGGGEMAQQLHNMIMVINTERQDRMLRMLFTDRNKLFPDIIESDPVLAAKHKREVVVTDEENKLAQRRRMSRERAPAIKSTSPVNPAKPMVDPTKYIVPNSPRLEKTKSPTPDEESTGEIVEKDDSDG